MIFSNLHKGFDSANTLDGVIAESLVKGGERTISSSNDRDRLGYVLSYAKNRKKALNQNNRALKDIEFQIQ